MYRSVGFAVAYLLLVAVAFIADAILVSAFVSSISRRTSELPRIVEKMGSGLVYGAYSIGPYYKEVDYPNYPGGSYVICVKGLHVVLVNPNSVPVEVVLLGVYYGTGGEAGLSGVLDIAHVFGIEWDGGAPPEGVEIVHPTWFPDPDVKYALRMMPRTTASFTIPAYYGEPGELLACTPVGCTKLQSIGATSFKPTEPAYWIIRREGEPPPTPGGVGEENPVVVQTWTWTATTIGGPMEYCCIDPPPPDPTSTCILITETSCCPGYTQTCSNFLEIRTACSYDTGSIESYSLVMGMPPTVIAGFYTTASDYGFEVPSKEISIGPYSYRLYGFSKSPGETGDRIYTDKWLNYNRHTCLNRRIRLVGTIRAEVGNEITTFKKLWEDSEWIYVYVATQGYKRDPTAQWNFPNPIPSIIPGEHDIITITVSYRERLDQDWKEVGRIESREGAFVDNSEELEELEEPTNMPWVIPTSAIEIKIEIEYYMETPAYIFPWGIPCFSEVFGILVNCGDEYPDRKIRLAYYIELIPSEFLS